jgi:hypothetical protein
MNENLDTAASPQHNRLEGSASLDCSRFGGSAEKCLTPATCKGYGRCLLRDRDTPPLAVTFGHNIQRLEREVKEARQLAEEARDILESEGYQVNPLPWESSENACDDSARSD